MDADECKDIIEKMKELERLANDDELTPITEYILSVDGVMMYKWKRLSFNGRVNKFNRDVHKRTDVSTLWIKAL